MATEFAEFLRMRISKILASSGYNVFEADNSLNSIRVYKAARPDGVLLDVAMPEMDGLTALKEIKALDPQARVVMLTALGQEAVTQPAIRDGAYGFITKPFEPKRLLEVVNETLAAETSR